MMAHLHQFWIALHAMAPVILGAGVIAAAAAIGRYVPEVVGRILPEPLATGRQEDES